MQIYFSGSFSVGKSTLKKEIATKYNLLKLPEIFRLIMAEREILDLSILRSNVSLLEEVQKEVLIRQFTEEKLLFSRAAQEGKKGIVACRGIDSIAFMIHLCRPEFFSEAKKTSWYEDYIDWLKKEGSTHFLLPPLKSLLVDDGFRDTDWDFSVEIYSTIKTLLRFYGIKYTQIREDNMSERLTIVSNVLGDV